MQRPFIQAKFSNGVGNNIFQYVYARLLAEHRGCDLYHPALPALNIPENDIRDGSALRDSPFKTVNLRLSSKDKPNYHRYFTNPQNKKNIILKCYPEDYTLYVPVIDKIRSWFADVPKTNAKDLVMHLRLGDRLVMAGCYRNDNEVPASEFVTAINSFQFERLHIVTDMPAWKPLTAKMVEAMTFHREVQLHDRVPSQRSADYFNSLYQELSKYKPIVRVGKSVKSDLDYMRSFDKILFQHSTLAWWAAALSRASHVGVYGPWRGAKDINLGWTDLPGWFRWGPETGPPRQIKVHHLKSLIRDHGIKLFVETGTKGGNTIAEMANHCKQAYSIEVEKPVYDRTKRQLGDRKNIKLLHGDSGKKLAAVLTEISEPALFWLDAHTSTETPIMQELSLISEAACLPHVLVIDDLRHFGSEYSETVKEIKSFISEKWPQAHIDTEYGAIRAFLGGRP